MVIKGVISDGDIRKQLLRDNDISKLAVNVMNNFVFGSEYESRESLIKKFDQAVNVLPILDSKENSSD